MKLRSLALAGALLVTPTLAHAQAEDAAGRVLFDEGRRLMDAGKYAEACGKFEEGQRVSPGIGMKFNLAECYERVGKLASAWAAFLDVASQARFQGQAERERVARRRAAALEPELAKLTVNVPPTSAVPGLEIRRDGVPVGRGQWGVPIPVDAGEHVMTISAPGRKTVERRVTLATTAGATATLEVPLLDVDPAAKEKATSTVVEDPNRGKPQRTVGLLVGGVGAAGLVAGSIFGILALNKHGESSDHCYPGNRCDSVGVSLREDAIANGNISTIAFAVGGGLVAVGAVLYLTAPSPRVQVGLAPAGASLRATF